MKPVNLLCTSKITPAYNPFTLGKPQEKDCTKVATTIIECTNKREFMVLCESCMKRFYDGYKNHFDTGAFKYTRIYDITEPVQRTSLGKLQEVTRNYNKKT